MNRQIAHVRREIDDSWAEPHLLDDHLKGTAEFAALFAKTFNSENWGYSVGIAHDTGKAPARWQEYLRNKSGYGFDEAAHLENISGKMEHAAPGAKLAEDLFPGPVGRILAYCIAGHHTGLPDWIGDAKALASRLQHADYSGIPEELKELIAFGDSPNPPWKFDNGLDISLWIRMVFSCLVDADFLDTEGYMDSIRTQSRGGFLSMRQLLNRFNDHMEKVSDSASATPVNSIRRTVLSDCRAAAGLEPGFFSLTVPTGGGKTLSSMAFALEHAVQNNNERIVYVIPYTSIIEQNAEVFCTALGDDQVVEHHSNINGDELSARARLSAENWDAPVIVTTSVQFFESLFAAKPGRCRKLHNISNSVVILDEAQLLPAGLLSPVLRSMELLAEHYKVSFVFCTATQPALEKQNGFPDFPGLKAGCVREIVKDVPALYRALQRVEVEVPRDLKKPVEWEVLADELQGFQSVLCVVSDRKSCRELFSLMPKGTYHLSALMCPQHRSDTIDKIKAGLRAGKATRVISTQLVEAGVDLDFPVVYRAAAGLDSIAQAAGRCNREGRLNNEGKLGKVVVFIPPRRSPPGILRKAQETAIRMLANGLQDPVDHGVFPQFFQELYWKANDLDEKGIIPLLTPDQRTLDISFRTAAEQFRMIDDTLQRSVLVPYTKGAELIELLQKYGPERRLLRKLQRYTVNIYMYQFDELLKRGSLKEISPGIFSLVCDIEYDSHTGLKADTEPFAPEVFMA